MGIRYSRFLITTINIGAEQRMWGKKKKRARTDALELAYVQRLQEIDALSAAHDDIGPSEWNMGLGQSEFLGRTESGDFPSRYIVVEVEDLPSFGQLREKSDDWIHVSKEEMLQQITGFWVVALRTSDHQTFQPASEVKYRFDSFQALQRFLSPLNISWQGASATERQLNQSGWSPGWLS
ncbi:hypothetical protein ACTXOF_14400 [Glutamicibacter arilaitensis]|uniref:hypothetical protein n=1 Tax=Glutamicibacter arilaitensis TaxID=256701 RepID=UPI003FD197B3